jgi:hypothetical protein
MFSEGLLIIPKATWYDIRNIRMLDCSADINVKCATRSLICLSPCSLYRLVNPLPPLTSGQKRLVRYVVIVSYLIDNVGEAIHMAGL